MSLWHSTLLHLTLAQHVPAYYFGTAHFCSLLWHSHISVAYCGTAHFCTLLWHSTFFYLTVAQHVPNLFFFLSVSIQWQLLAKPVDTLDMNSFVSNTKCWNRVVRIKISFTRVPLVSPPSTKFNQNPFICSGDQTCRLNGQTHFCSIRLCFAVCAKAAHTDERTATYCKNYHYMS
jgi:hypothetical protein